AGRKIDADQKVADVDAIGRCDDRGSRDLAPVDVGAVRALEVGALHPVAALRQARVPLRDVAFRQDDVVTGDASNGDLVLVEGEHLWLASLFGQRELDHRPSPRVEVMNW